MSDFDSPPQNGFDFGKLVERFTRFDAARLSEPTSQLLAAPKDFFATLKSRSMEDAAFFFLCIGAVITILHLIGGLLFGRGLQLSMLAVMPIVLVISLAISTIILHLIIGPLLGGQGTFEDAFKIVCYTFLSQIIMWIPWVSLIGVAVGFLWLIVAAIEVYRVEPSRAKAVLGGLGAVVLLMSLFGHVAASRAEKVASRFEESARQLEQAADRMAEETESMAEQRRREADEAFEQMR